MHLGTCTKCTGYQRKNCTHCGWMVGKSPGFGPMSSHRTAEAWILSLDLESPEVGYRATAAQPSDGGSKLGLLTTQRAVTEQQELDPTDGRLRLQFRTQGTGYRATAARL